MEDQMDYFTHNAIKNGIPTSKRGSAFLETLHTDRVVMFEANARHIRSEYAANKLLRPSFVHETHK